MFGTLALDWFPMIYHDSLTVLIVLLLNVYMNLCIYLIEKHSKLSYCHALRGWKIVPPFFLSKLRYVLLITSKFMEKLIVVNEK